MQTTMLSNTGLPPSHTWMGSRSLRSDMGEQGRMKRAIPATHYTKADDTGKKRRYNTAHAGMRQQKKLYFLYSCDIFIYVHLYLLKVLHKCMAFIRSDFFSFDSYEWPKVDVSYNVMMVRPLAKHAQIPIWEPEIGNQLYGVVFFLATIMVQFVLSNFWSSLEVLIYQFTGLSYTTFYIDG